MNNYGYGGQVGGWNQQNIPNAYSYQPYQNGNGFIDPNFYQQLEEKKKDKKILRTISFYCGLAIIAFFVSQIIISVVLMLFSEIDSRWSVVFGSGVEAYAINCILTVLCIGGPFLGVYFILKSKKIAGTLPFGTVYNAKAAVYLTGLLLPVMLISSIAINMISSIIQIILGLEFTSGLEDIAINSPSDFIFMSLFMAVCPAILEEFIFRGVVLQPLRRYGDWFAIITSAIMFSLLHGNMVQVPYTVVCGLYLGYLTVATGSIWPSIVLHFFNNFFSVVVTTLDCNMDSMKAGLISYSILGGLVIIGIIFGVLFKKMNYKHRFAKGVKSLKFGDKLVATYLNVPMIIALIILIVSTIGSIAIAE